MSSKLKNNSKHPAPHLVGHIELLPVDQLIPYACNARTHSKKQIRQIAASIREFGFVNPILIGSNNRIVAGHARLRAAQELGMQQVPVIVLEHLSEEQRRALVLADNQLALNAGWDEELLRTELAALAKEEFSLDLIGFDEAELVRLLAEQDAAEGLHDPDAAPPVPDVPASMPGDLWILGEHRLLCGDATKRADLDIVMDDQKAAMVFTDPPADRIAEIEPKPRLETDPAGRFEKSLEEACTHMMKLCVGAMYLCTRPSNLHPVYQAFTAAGGRAQVLIWAKQRFIRGRLDYQEQYEPILYGWPAGADHYWCGARDQSDVWFIADLPAKRSHAAMQPVELVERAVENSSQVGDTVLDPFAGAGTTLIACQRLKRRARLIELDARYVDVICRRWEQFSGQLVLHANGMTFADLARERDRKAA